MKRCIIVPIHVRRTSLKWTASVIDVLYQWRRKKSVDTVNVQHSAEVFQQVYTAQFK